MGSVCLVLFYDERRADLIEHEVATLVGQQSWDRAGL